MQIVDNSPELALDDPQLAAMLNSATEPTPKPDKTDDKTKAPASSAEAKESDQKEDETPETPETLKAQIKGLQAELARRKGNAEKVEELDTQIKQLQTELRASKSKPVDVDVAWIQKLDDEALADKHTDWDDELSDARAKYGRAEEANDDQSMARQGQRILQAKKMIAAFKREELSRTKRHQEELTTQREVETAIKTELDELYGTVSESFPEFQDQDSALWKAGNEEYLAHPQLMRALGKAGDVVAAALAIVRNPDLVAKKSTAGARREVIGSIEKSVKKALATGASSPSTQRAVDINVDSGEGLANFNKMIDRIKGG